MHCRLRGGCPSRFADVSGTLEAFRAAARGLGVVLPDPIVQLAFRALPVIARLKTKERGRVDFDRFARIDGRGREWI